MAQGLCSGSLQALVCILQHKRKDECRPDCASWMSITVKK